MPKLVVLSDDITGCVDSGALLASAGCSVHVSLDPEKIGNVGGSDVLSVNLSSRTLPHEEARSVFRRTAEKVRLLGYEIVMKKLDTGFRGNASQEIEGVMEALQIPYCFLMAHAPWRSIYTLHGIQYFEGVPLAKSLVAKEDPLKKPGDSFLPEILEKDSRLKVDYVDIDDVRSGFLVNVVRKMLDDGVQLLVLDAMTTNDSVHIVRQLHRFFPKAMWAGSGGLTWGICRELFGKEPLAEAKTVTESPKCLCFSGSAYSTTKRQIDLCVKAGVLKEVSVDIGKCIKDQDDEIDRVVRECLKAQEQTNTIVTPKVDENVKIDNLPVFILEMLQKCAVRLIPEADFGRLVIIGGETSQAILRKIGANELIVEEKTETGIGTGRILDGVCKGKSFSMKGGVGGSTQALFHMMGIDGQEEDQYDC